ncbi:hypothetical protein [Anaerotruncus sp. DFI.9.16]|uniref:hypothetical protein n=1 Tax=Anaerotruncus sp. DFI.9.16 TaxID=2965275 RepID=UPI00210D2EAB|nr:hypothetical protein [Anaerotruncus sp. DFI.9.16]MCQ4894906.1 hypothetical protein [Anaerotruncus sp. DFI.9.16]
MSWAEAKWVVDNILQKVGQAPNNMRAFSVSSVSKTSLGVRFLEPEDSYDSAGNLICSVGGVMIRMSETDYPANTSDGTLVIDNKDLGKCATDAFEVSGLVEGKTYYFSAFPYSSQGVYNLSSDESNRATGSPADGEKVTVNVSIDDTTGFSSVTITCVDETNPTETKTATITATQRTASFTVPIGDTYHIEYGAADGYSKPDNTASKVSVAGETTTYEATYYYFTATINVTYPSGATLTCSYGSTVYTATTTTGSYQFKVHEVGTWVIKAVQGSEEVSTSVSITTDGQSESVELSFVKIYGISRNVTSSSPAWARTDDAVGLTATASVGTTAGSSDFDNCAPWSGMTRETLSTGDVMVKIPKFWYRRYKEGDIEYIKIADKATTGFTLHPLFNHAGVESDCAYVGAYKTSSNNKSVSGASPQVSQTRATFHSNAKAKGTGWSLIDIAAVSAIQMLCMVEFATTNAQAAIGRGYCDSNSAALSTGSCNNVANLTGRPAGTDGKTGVVYRGIEDFWGNVWEWVDGVNWNGGTYYVCNNPANYADDTATNYTALSYKGNTGWSSSYITTEGLDTGNNSHVMLPSAAGSGSESTYYCDACWSSTGWRVFQHGGGWNYGSHCGLFTAVLNYSSSSSSANFGSRLLYIPS